MLHSILEYSKADQADAPSKQTGLDIDLLEIAVEHLIKWLGLTPEERAERMHDRLGLYFVFNFKQWIDHLLGYRGDGREKNDFLQTVTIYSMELARYVKQLEGENIEG